MNKKKKSIMVTITKRDYRERERDNKVPVKISENHAETNSNSQLIQKRAIYMILCNEMRNIKL